MDKLTPFATYVSGVYLVAVLSFTSTSVSAADSQPSVTKQPSDVSVSLGANITLGITATGSPTPTYQWYFQGSPLSGATNRNLSLINIHITHAGEYYVELTNPSGTEISRVAVLDVDPAFTKIMNSPVLSPGGSAAVAWGDVNNDGHLDLFVGAAPQNLYTNRGDGTFSRVSAGPITTDGFRNGAVWGDYDNDGFLDLLVSAGNNVLYRNNGNGGFSKITTNALVRSGSWCGAWGDYDNDGWIDFFGVSGFTKAANTLFRNSGNGTFLKVTNSIISRDTPEFSQGASWGDYDNDGRLDLFVANARDFNNGNKRRPSFLYRNLGGGAFEKITNSVIIESLHGHACGVWGDYDNDGFLDLFACGYANEQNKAQQQFLFHNERNGTFTIAAQAGSIVSDVSFAQGAAWVDYDNDGHLDLFVAAGGSSAFNDLLYRNNGDGTFTRIMRGSLVNDNGEGAGCGWGDVNNDGFQDLYVSNFQNQTPEKNALYINNGNSNSWAVFRLKGRISNRAGIGAKVRVKAVIKGKEVWQLREISGSGGYLSQSSLDACFGLSDATALDIVRVEWSSGMVQELRNVQARQFITIREPAFLGLMADMKAGGVEITLRGGFGIAYQIETSTNLLDWVPLWEAIPSAAGVQFQEPLSPMQSLRFFRVNEK